MTDTSSKWENLLIYYTNLSPLYLCSSIFSALVLFLTWWFNPRHRRSSDSDSEHEESDTSAATSEYKQRWYKNLGDDSGVTDSNEDWNTDAIRPRAGYGKTDHSTMKHIKSVRHAAIEKELTAGLSEEQLKKERETQATQLKAIYKLLKEKEDQFKIKSMDELQEQLKLYKT